MGYLENDLAPSIPLDGEWLFTLGDAAPIKMPVPAAWEAHLADKVTDGPAHYWRTFQIQPGALGHKVLLEAQAISFDATVRMNGRLAGTHRGMWSPFQIDVTEHVRLGGNSLEIDVWKPGGRFPPREALAGFLPDVCNTFGGLWQSIQLRGFPRAALDDLRVVTNADRVDVTGSYALFYPSDEIGVTVELWDGDSRRLSEWPAQVDVERRTFSAEVAAPDGVSRWEAKDPDGRLRSDRRDPASSLYRLVILLTSRSDRIAQATRRIGFRDLRIQGRNTFLNGQPVHFRGVLDWGWDAQKLCPTPTREELIRNFAAARALGFNLFKLCLFVPDEATFQVADEEGMWLWLEMPMWVPRAEAPEVRALALNEYREVFRRVHHHPSIAIVSLGCELNSQADADFLHELHALAREWLPNALVCDNSGSAEAYGGVLTSLSDFYDYHFYTDPHFFEPLVQHFDRAYQPAKPWLYGEFCDADTLRDYRQLPPDTWWLAGAVTLDRDENRWQREYRQRLSAAGIADGGAELTRIARRQATAIRKFILERVRRANATGGYVITGWIDTPITTSGVVDDQHQLKFPPDEWQRFNADAVLTIDRERRRRWVGGDRPWPKDPFTWWQGERAEIHLICSNGQRDFASGRLTWTLRDSDGTALASGSEEIGPLPSAEAREIAILNATMPSAALPLELHLSAQLQLQPELELKNSWTLWAVPRPRLAAPLAVAEDFELHHPFAQLDRAAHLTSLDLARREAVALADRLTPHLLNEIAFGRSALLWLTQPDERFTRPLPFWKEAIHIFQPHAIWEQVPHPGYGDMRFFSVATDFALDVDRLAELLGPDTRLTPIWRRFDARAMFWADYLVEVRFGRGRLIVSTLRFTGGLGAQPNSFETNPFGAWLITSLIDVLAKMQN